MKIDSISARISALLKGEQKKELDDIRNNITTLGGGVLIQRGTISARNIGANAGITVAITFDIPFDVAPTVVINHSNGGGGFADCMWDARSITTTGFSAYCWHGATGTGTAGATWIAIGTTSPMNQYDIYSTEETLVGQWNNKPLYRRIISGNTPAQNAAANIYTVTNCTGIVFMTGSIIGKDNVTSIVPNISTNLYHYASGANRVIGMYETDANLSGRPYTIVIHYTKT